MFRDEFREDPVGFFGQENFVHKRIGGAIMGGLGSMISGGNPMGGAARGFIGGGGGPAAAVASILPGKFTPGQLAGTLEHIRHGHTIADPGHDWMTPSLLSQALATVPGGSITGCSPPMVPDQSGVCVFPTSPGDISTGPSGGFGQAVIGRYGAALVPSLRTTTTRSCPPGAVLGKDGMCYNTRDLRNTERKWPKGRAPLLTGGEMRAIGVASSASRKLERKTKQLQKMGMMKKPTPRARRASGAHSH